MKIYFTGSIRGGREHAGWYAATIKILQGYGQVLTEHVGRLDLPEDGEALPVDHIFERDIKWLGEADVLVADVTIPSLGVGYEIARAEILGKPVLCLFHSDWGRKLSGMIEGNKNLHVEWYKSAEEVSEILKKFFNEIQN